MTPAPSLLRHGSVSREFVNCTAAGTVGETPGHRQNNSTSLCVQVQVLGVCEVVTFPLKHDLLINSLSSQPLKLSLLYFTNLFLD